MQLVTDADSGEQTVLDRQERDLDQEGRRDVAADRLTARELEVLDRLAAGHSTAEIARLLWVTPATVSKHLEHVYRKLGVRSRTAALVAAGLVRSPGSG